AAVRKIAFPAASGAGKVYIEWQSCGGIFLFAVGFYSRLHLRRKNRESERLPALFARALCANLPGLPAFSNSGSSVSTENVVRCQTGRAFHGTSLESRSPRTGRRLELSGVVAFGGGILLSNFSFVLSSAVEVVAANAWTGDDRTPGRLRS